MARVKASCRSKVGTCAASAITTTRLPGITAWIAWAAAGGVDSSRSPTTTVVGHFTFSAMLAASASRNAAAQPSQPTGSVASSIRRSPLDEASDWSTTQRPMLASAIAAMPRVATVSIRSCQLAGPPKSSAVSQAISDSTRSGAIAATRMAICPPMDTPTDMRLPDAEGIQQGQRVDAPASPWCRGQVAPRSGRGRAGPCG